MHPNILLKQKHLLLTLLVLICCISTVFADSYYFFVKFTDKNNSPFTLQRQDEFLSERSIARRAVQGIVCDSTDLPVNPTYIAQVASLGIHVHSSSKWINGVTVILEDSSLMSQVRALPFVLKVQYTGKKFNAQSSPIAKSKTFTETFNYGNATTQINQLNGQALHDYGCLGNGILIGVLDTGFKNVDINAAFDSLRTQNRLLEAISVIDPTINVYNEDAHGAYVLSTMAANLPGQYLGVAPKASYLLIQTEYVPTEYLVETDFWVRGIELADSVGVDVINSSLGYSEFDDSSMNFTYADMNGKVSRASIAAEMAAEKGILVCSSAGNEGGKPWKYISSPADADGILAVGAVTNTSIASGFSSFGPSSDNRIKPEVCAQGTGTALVSTDGSMMSGSGTSFSSPVIAGLAACYLQLLQTQSSFTVSSAQQNIISSGNRYLNPEAQLGYGVPDFQKVIDNTLSERTIYTQQNELFKLHYEPLSKEIIIEKSPQFVDDNCYLELFYVSGNLILRERLTAFYTSINAAHLSPGIYITRLSNTTTSQLIKIFIP